MRKKTRMQRIDEWLTPRYGPLVENPYAQFSMKGVDWRAAFNPPKDKNRGVSE